MYRRQLRILFVQRIVLIVLATALLVAVLRIWKFEGRGASEWYTEYTMMRYENERLIRCMMEFDMQVYYKRQDGIIKFCKL